MMKSKIGFLVLATASAAVLAEPEDPSLSGLVPRTDTFYVNEAWNNNGLNSLGVAITSNQDVVVAWEDDHTPSSAIRHWAAVWTLYDRDGNLLTPVETIESRNALMEDEEPTSIETSYRSFFRNDGSPTPGRTGWGPKIKANPFGPGFGMGAVSYAVNNPLSASGRNGIGNEIPHLHEINFDLSTNAEGDRVGGAFAPVQLVNNDGTSAGPTLAGGTAANYGPPGDVRIGDWHYLANGNVVIVNESRQEADRALTGQESGNTLTYRVVTPAGDEVKAWSAVSSAPGASDMWHGVGVTANGFAVRWGFNDGSGQRATLRLFDNSGNPVSENIDIGTVAGMDEAAGGGRGDGTGFQGNGTDAYVYANTANGTPFVTVLNADGTLRWARRLADEDDETPPNSDRLDAAISADGRVVVIFDADNQYPDFPGWGRVIFGRMFSATGEPLGGIFQVSEKEGEFPPEALGFSRHARVAWRGNLIAVVWESHNNSDVTSNRIVGARLFETIGAPKPPIAEPAIGLTPRTETVYVNEAWNNNGLNSLGVAITSNQDVVVAWEDDHTPSSAIRHWAAVWTLYDRDGNLLTPVETIESRNALMEDEEPTSIETSYRSFFRNDGSPTPGRTAWGPKVKANPFGPGFGMGAVSYAVNNPLSASGRNGIGNEIPHLHEINFDLSTNADGDRVGGAFAPVQLVNNDGTSAGPTLAGGTAANYGPPGDVRIGDWHYLANGNVVIVNESRQEADRALTGQESGNTLTYRVVTPAGDEVKAWSAVSSAPGASDMWHGVGVTANGFAVRWGFNDGSGQRATLRLFDNSGNPVSENIDIGTVAGMDEAAGGGRGDGTGFHGNGTDAYVYANTANGTPFVTVLNADGTLRWARRLADEDDETPPNSDRLDAAISADGRVVVIFDATNQFPDEPDWDQRVILGRMFSATGQPVGPIFRVSEKEGEFPPEALGFSRHARVAWRGNLIAVVWESHNNSDVTSNRIVGLRLFDTGEPTIPGGISITGNTLVGSDFTITWSGGSPPFTVQRMATIGGTWEDVATGLETRSFTTSIAGADQGYYRIASQGQ